MTNERDRTGGGRARSALVTLVILLAVGVATGWILLEHGEPSMHYLQVMSAPSRLLVGGRHALRVAVRDVNSRRTVAGATVTLVLAGDGGRAELARGTSDEAGVVGLTFETPDLPHGAYQLRFETRSALASDVLSRDVSIERAAQLLVAVDKPLYQPGHTIQVRALARQLPRLAPQAGQALDFELIDPRSNKVFRRTIETSAYGIAAVAIPLADELLLGRYRVRVTRPGERPDTVERIVTVKRYVLPPFRVDARLAGDARYVKVGQTAQLAVSARYLFGAAVEGGRVEVTPTAEARRWLAFRGWNGTLDAEGRAVAPVSVDPRLRFRRGTMRVPLTVKVTDRAGHAESRTVQLTISRHDVLIDVLPRAGALVGTAGPQPVVVSTIRPDGQPLACEVQLTSEGVDPVSVRTGPLGLATVELPAVRHWRVTATAGELRGERQVYLGHARGASLLIRAEQALHRVGDALVLRLMGGRPGPVFVDVCKDDQTLYTGVSKAGDTLRLPLSADMAGLLEVSAYQVGPQGPTLSGSLPVFVAHKSDLMIAGRLVDAATGKAPKDGRFRPGTRVRYEVALSDAGGEPVVGALSAAIIDRAVLALAEAAPGMASPAAAFERELARPRAQVLGRGAGRVIYEDRRGDATTYRTLSPAVLARQDLARADREAAAGFLLARRAATATVAPRLQDGRQDKLRAHQAFVVRWRGRCLWSLVGLALLSLLGLMWLYPTLRLTTLTGLLVFGTIAGLMALVPWLELDRELRHLDPSEVLSITFGGGAAVLLVLLLLIRALFGVERPFVLSYLMHALVPLGALGAALLIDWLQARPDGPTDALLLAFGAYSVVVAGVGLVFLGLSRGRLGLVVGSLYNLPALAIVLGAGLWLYGEDPRQLFWTSSRSLRSGNNSRVVYDSAIEGDMAVPRTAALKSPGGSAPLKQARVRKRFVETLLWRPELITDARGRAQLEFELADNITGWRTLLEAVDARGRLGFQQTGFTTFEPFFIRPDLPAQLTQGDEVTLPIALHNHADVGHDVQLALEPAPWYEVVGPARQVVSLRPHQVTSRAFRLRITQFGSHVLKIGARSTAYADAVERRIEVVPDGRRVEGSASGPLASGTLDVALPPAAAPGTARAWLKVYPGVAADVVEGLDGLLRMPHG